MAHYREKKIRNLEEVIAPWKLTKKYLLFSFLLWFGLGIVFFVVFFNWDQFLGGKLRFWSEEAIYMQLFASILWLIAVTFLWSVLICIPTIISIFFIRQNHITFENISANTSWKILTWQRVRPFIFWGTNLIFLLISLGAIPQFSNYILPGEQVLSRLSVSVFDVFYSEFGKDNTNIWKKKFSQDNPQILIIQLPASLLAIPQYFPRLKRELGDPFNYYIETNKYVENLNNLLFNSNEKYMQFTNQVFQGPSLPITSWYNNEKLQEKEVLIQTMGEEKNSSFFGNVSSISELKPAVEFNSKDSRSLSLTAAINERLIKSQPQLGIFLRASILKYIKPEWDFDNIVADDSYAVEHFLQDKKENNQSLISILQLNELENVSDKYPFRSIRWNYGDAAFDFEVRVKTLDILLKRAVNGVKYNKNVAILVLPYPETTGDIQFSTAFLKLPKTEKGEIAEENLKFLRRKTLTTKDINLIIDTFLNKGTFEVEKHSGMRCQTSLVRTASLLKKNNDNYLNNYTWYENLQVNNLTIDIPKYNRILEDSYMNYVSYCNDVFDSNPDFKNTDINEYVLVWKNEAEIEKEFPNEFLDKDAVNFRQVLFHPYPETLNFLKRTKGRYTPPIKISQEQERNIVWQNTFLDKYLNIYTSSIKNNVRMNLKLEKPELKQSFIAKYYVELSSILKGIIQNNFQNNY